MELASSNRFGRRISGLSAVRPVAAVQRWWRWRRERNELLAMDNRALRDIGLTRLDAVAEARKPFWRA